MLNDIQKRIMELKKEKDVCILAHCYQTHDILEVADFVGDSFGLAQKAAKAPNAAVMMCGVRFMAETVKILSPEKRVLIPREEAGCPMAEQLDVEMLTQLRQMYPDHKVVAYINTTAALKTLSDVCVTSSSAVKIIKKLDADKILFIPDCNLGDFVKKQVPEKEIQLMVNEDQSMDESNVDDTWNSDDVQPEPSTTDKLKHLAIPVGIVGVVLAAVILVVIRRKKKKAGMDDEIL